METKVNEHTPSSLEKLLKVLNGLSVTESTDYELEDQLDQVREDITRIKNKMANSSADESKLLSRRMEALVKKETELNRKVAMKRTGLTDQSINVVISALDDYLIEKNQFENEIKSDRAKVDEETRILFQEIKDIANAHAAFKNNREHAGDVVTASVKDALEKSGYSFDEIQKIFSDHQIGDIGFPSNSIFKDIKK